jgi:DNA-binding winged helix-turn-helix (wHTH) protein/TolB-like protein/cytochrome c-type biogenesis protein CcmH/NrfG
MRAAGETDRPKLDKQFRVGPWLVTPALDELRRGDEHVKLEPKAMEVLLFLAARPGEPVSRDELLSGVWPGVIVGDDVLTQAVTKLRKALGDDARSPSYIETIAKRGYRLVAPVDALNGVSSVRASSGTGISTDWRAAAVGVLLTTVIAVAYLSWATLNKSGSAVVEDYLTEKVGVRAGSPLPTVTVMPFEPLSDQPQHAYLARSIVADLTTNLSRLEGLRVIGSSTASDQTHGARYVVSGSLQRGGDQLKVNVQLTDTQTGQHIWSERYERPFQDFFAIQEEMVARLVGALRVEVSEAERRRLAGRHTRNLEAYDYFLRARAALWTRQRADNEKARELYGEALRLDPKFARAYAGLALTYAADYRHQWTEQGPQALTRAVELAETALGIDPDIPEVHWVLAYVDIQGRRHDQAIARLKHALTLDRSFADAYSLLGNIYTHIGEPKKAVPLLRAAGRLDPDRGYSYFVSLGRTYFFLGDAEQASINLREALSRNAGSLEAHVYLAATLTLASDREGASWEANEVRVLAPSFSTRKWLETYPMTDMKQKQQLVRLLGSLGL